MVAHVVLHGRAGIVPQCWADTHQGNTALIVHHVQGAVLLPPRFPLLEYTVNVDRCFHPTGLAHDLLDPLPSPVIEIARLLGGRPASRLVAEADQAVAVVPTEEARG